MTLTGTARSVGALALLGAALPANAAVTGAALLLRRPPRPPVPLHGRRTVLVSGGKMTKALELCRAFHDAGHRVVLVESAKYRLTGHRFSRAVDRFRTVPDSGAEDYAQELLRIVEEERVDVYVPVCSPASSAADARAKAVLSRRCEVLHLDAGDLEQVDDKYQFFRAARLLGLPVPDTHRITDPQQVLDFDFSGATRPYVLKSIAYDPVHRLDLTRLPFGPPEAMTAFVRSLPITADNPWILQEFVEGQEYCTHGTVRDGRLAVYCCCESSAFQVNYAPADRPRIRDWVERFVDALGLTGQVSFDFIEDADGTPYAIECNPRTHSAITLLHGHERLAAAYLSDDGTSGTVVPDLDARPTYWLYHELWRLAVDRGRRNTVRTILSGRDAIFAWEDPLPFLLVHHLQIPALLLGSARRGGSWLRIDFNIGKLVEPAGD